MALHLNLSEIVTEFEMCELMKLILLSFGIKVINSFVRCTVKQGTVSSSIEKYFVCLGQDVTT